MPTNFGHLEKSKLSLLALANVKEIEPAHQTDSVSLTFANASGEILLLSMWPKLGTLLVNLFKVK